MSKKLLLATIAAAGLTLGIASANAADVEPMAEPASWYVSLFGGASWLEDVDTDYAYNDGRPGPLHNSAETDTGFIIGGAFGTHLTDDLRVELEVAYSENDVEHLNYSGPYANGTEKFDGTGKFGILTFMANVWYDVPLSEDLKPYLGGGAGVAIVDADEIGYSPPDHPRYDSSEVAFAFQVGGGLRWAIWENVTLDVGYRLRGIDGPKFDNVEDEVPQSGKYDADWMWSHNVIAGVSFGF